VKVYISVDMEGVAGVNHPAPTARADSRYPDAVALMVGEANAAIRGAFDGGATEVLVNDSHGAMFNLRPAELDRRARVLQGQKAWSMVEGAGPDRGFGVALFVGYHARAGHPRGTIAHTYSGRPTSTRLNGRLVGETGINAAVLGAWGVPVGLVTGDDALAEEVAEWLPWAERVVVKSAVGGSSAASLHPAAAEELIEAGAKAALADLSVVKPYDPGRPCELAIEFTTPDRLQEYRNRKSVEVTGPCSLVVRGDDWWSAWSGFFF